MLNMRYCHVKSARKQHVKNDATWSLKIDKHHRKSSRTSTIKTHENMLKVDNRRMLKVDNRRVCRPSAAQKAGAGAAQPCPERACSVRQVPPPRRPRRSASGLWDVTKSTVDFGESRSWPLPFTGRGFAPSWGLSFAPSWGLSMSWPCCDGTFSWAKIFFYFGSVD